MPIATARCRGATASHLATLADPARLGSASLERSPLHETRTRRSRSVSSRLGRRPYSARERGARDVATRRHRCTSGVSPPDELHPRHDEPAPLHGRPRRRGIRGGRRQRDAQRQCSPFVPPIASTRRGSTVDNAADSVTLLLPLPGSGFPLQPWPSRDARTRRQHAERSLELELRGPGTHREPQRHVVAVRRGRLKHRCPPASLPLQGPPNTKS